MKNKRVILAMSGGVDSSVAAYLLKRKGYSVIGITFKLWPEGLCGSHGPKNCCSLEAIEDARSVCSTLKIPHYVIDCEKLFRKKVVGYFIRSYESGSTPNPCIICNEKIKFPLLLKKAKEIGAGYIATGHHARCAFDRRLKRFVIKEGKDRNKDQSYVLFSLSQDVLSRLILAVGDFTKEKIKAIAKRLNLKPYKRKESQEICFVADNNLERFLKQNLSKEIRPGHIKDSKGSILGRHRGTTFFTIGQRKGLGIPFGEPLYIIDIDHKNGDIIIGDYKQTLKEKFTAENLSWIVGPKRNQDYLNVEVKIRYRHPKSKALVRLLSPKDCEVEFTKPQSSPTPGQAAVFYDKATVLGGGWIKK